jgi:hypothetical protein
MKRLIASFFCCLIFLLAAPAQVPPSDLADDTTPIFNASQFGVKYPEKFVLMQNRMGIRIEYVIDRGRLQLWISPQAGKSMSYRDRNFSNRDDHSDVFERIVFPDLAAADFIACDYDPFHSVLRFKGQSLHIAQVYDQPVVLIWFEKDGVVDFKSAKEDHVVERTPRVFHVSHPDRGYVIDHVVLLGAGGGVLQHQHALDDGRPTYARAHLKAGQLIAIAAELQKEHIRAVASRVLSEGIDATLAANERKIAVALDTGRFRLKGRPDMQKLLDLNRRIALSMQDEHGFMRSTSQFIYYLLWFRDGGMNTAHLAQTGWLRPAQWQAQFALLNPNTSADEPTGRFFGQLMAGPITKREEDGLFYAVWPAFLYWSATGDDTFTKGEYIKSMEDGMDWLERYTFDQRRGLFFRYYHGESNMSGSYDDAYDAATGAAEVPQNSLYQGRLIRKSYDVYINSINLACYYMMSAMESGEKADIYLKKAKALEQNLEPFYKTSNSLPDYGELITDKGDLVEAKPFGMDAPDYQWSLSLPMFRPFQPKNFRRYQQSLLQDLKSRPGGMFISSYAGVLTALDTELHNEDDVMAALDYLVPQSARSGKYLPMPGAIPEIVDMTDGDMYHDVRPIVFSIAPWLSAVTNLGVCRLPFGVAVRGTRYLESIDHYEYGGGLLDITYRGQGTISRVIVNGQPLEGTLQIPENRIVKGVNRIEVEMTPGAMSTAAQIGSGLNARLIASSVRLESVDGKRYHIHAYGQNTLTFKGLTMPVNVTTSDGKPVSLRTETDGDISWYEFEGRGQFVVTLGAR